VAEEGQQQSARPSRDAASISDYTALNARMLNDELERIRRESRGLIGVLLQHTPGETVVNHDESRSGQLIKIT
jgi:hypothetical protein